VRRTVRVFLLDNHDSFTWNLAQALMVLGATVEVELSDSVSISEIREGRFDALVVSPGPGRAEDAGMIVEAVALACRFVPVLGVCLGHQAVALAFGARVVHAPHPVHGKTSLIRHDGSGVFRGIPSPFTATRYHSLCVEAASLPDCLLPTAWSSDGVIMGLRHRDLPVEGVQFHPESIATPWGPHLLGNFVSRVASPRDDAIAP
jgi:anthranilate synthase component 2